MALSQLDKAEIRQMILSELCQDISQALKVVSNDPDFVNESKTLSSYPNFDSSDYAEEFIKDLFLYVSQRATTASNELERVQKEGSAAADIDKKLKPEF